MSSAGLSIGCSGGRDAPAAELLPLWATNICRPVGALTISGTLHLGHACSSVITSFQPPTSHWSLGWVSCFRLPASAYSRSAWSTYRTPTLPLLPFLHPRCVKVCSRPELKYAHVLCTLDLLRPSFPGSEFHSSRGCLSVAGLRGSRRRCPECGMPYRAL